MKVFCGHNPELDVFLKEAVNYTLNLYGKNLRLDALQEIELWDRKEIEYDTDGKTLFSGTKIIITSRLYEKLPSLNIAELQDNEDFLQIVNTLFHEMGHVSDWLSMPKLYKCVEESISRKYSIVALFWLEYLAEKRSCIEGRADHTEFCRDFIGREWRSYKNEDANWTESNFLYLNKVLAYFMGRTTKPGDRVQYMSKMVNPLLKEYIKALEPLISKLEKEMPFDDASKLNDLFEVINRYFKMFNRRYRQ